ncbi:Prefoldin, subunit 3 [Cystobasidium minutum MCA 4210]|uniref:Prefoldin, subunit 3 n=1 Tax=Cystobasidium minutum MCA 4210 TaxID=1397322 RepID=UPI0034CDC7FC|eukprot:jgi/Rhomi1/21344/CE21343_1704
MSSDTPVSTSSGRDVQVNPRGIPKAAFIESVDAFLGGSDVEAEPELAKLNEMLAKYRFMEKSFAQKRAGLEEKMVEFKQTLDVLSLLEAKKEADETLVTNFELTETLYAKAAIEPVEEVFLWLGANTMLSYPPKEAQRLLTDKLETAQTSFENTKADLLFLREQITTTEVNIARLYNHDVKLRRERRLREAEEEK